MTDDKKKMKLMDKLRRALDLEPIPDPPDPLPQTIVAQGGYTAPLDAHTTFDTRSLHVSWGSTLTSKEIDDLREMLEWYRKMKTP